MAYLVFANSGSWDVALGVLFGGSYHLNKNEMEYINNIGLHV
jgi:hypothetical protein